MADYAFGGLLIESQIPLPGLCLAHPADGLAAAPPAPGIRPGISPDITIEYAIAPAPQPDGPVLFVWKGRFGLVLSRHGDGWIVRDIHGNAVQVSACARQLSCFTPSPETLPLLQTLLVRRILATVSTLHDRMNIHAASLAGDDGAILLMGISGAGKSTLTTALAQTGQWRVFSDDMTILGGLNPSDADSQPQAWPACSGISLWQQSQQALALAEADCPGLAGYDGKISYVPQPMLSHAPARPRAVIFLCDAAADGQIAWQRVTGIETRVMAASQMQPFNPTDRTATAKHMQQVLHLMTTTAAYTLAYPRDFAMLPRCVDAIRQIYDDAITRPL